jgi:serine/threonine-protein phosphatase PGAM5
MARRTLYLIRHAQQAEQTPVIDRFGPSLTSLGREQARLLGERLSGQRIDTIYYSTLRRAAETASILAEQINRGRQNEPVEMSPSRLLWECIPVVPAWGKEFFAETPPEVIERHARQALLAYEKFFRAWLGDECSQVIVSSGNLIRYLALRALGAPPELWTNADIAHGSLTIVTIDSDGHMMLAAFNDTGHLPGGMVT